MADPSHSGEASFRQLFQLCVTLDLWGLVTVNHQSNVTLRSSGPLSRRQRRKRRRAAPVVSPEDSALCFQIPGRGGLCSLGHTMENVSSNRKRVQVVPSCFSLFSTIWCLMNTNPTTDKEQKAGCPFISSTPLQKWFFIPENCTQSEVFHWVTCVWINGCCWLHDIVSYVSGVLGLKSPVLLSGGKEAILASPSLATSQVALAFLHGDGGQGDGGEIVGWLGYTQGIHHETFSAFLTEFFWGIISLRSDLTSK